MRRDFPTSTEQILEQIAALAEQVRDLTAKVDRVLGALEEDEDPVVECPRRVWMGVDAGSKDHSAVAFIGEAGTVPPSVWEQAALLDPDQPRYLRVRVNPDVQVWDPTTRVSPAAAQARGILYGWSKSLQTPPEVLEALEKAAKGAHDPTS